MKNWNVHPLAQGLFDDEARWRSNVFKVDAAKGRFQQLDCVDKAVNIFGLHFNVDRINIGEAFEQDGLAFHHRLGGKSTQIAHAQNRSAV